MEKNVSKKTLQEDKNINTIRKANSQKGETKMATVVKADTKTLKRATPTVRKDTGIVRFWEITVIHSFAGDAENNLPAFEKEYTESVVDVEYLNKTPTEFAKSELIGFMGDREYLFNVHYHMEHFPETISSSSEKVSVESDFDFNSIPD